MRRAAHAIATCSVPRFSTLTRFVIAMNTCTAYPDRSAHRERSLLASARRGISALVVGTSLVLLSTAQAQEASPPVAYIKTLTGSAFVVSGQTAQPAKIGMPIYLGNVLRTAAQSSMGVSFVDNTLMSFGPGTELRVDEYTYAPAEGRLTFATSLMRGTLNYISGVIAKLQPEAVVVKTPTGVIGVRGTQFVARVRGETP